MRTTRSVPSPAFLALFASLALFAAPPGLAAQSVLVEAKTTAGNEVATIRTDSMRLLVPLHLLVGGLLFPDGTVQTTAATGATSVTSAQIVDSTIVDADISASAAITDGKLATIRSFGKVANSATTATSHNVPGSIVARDGTGGFTASYLQAGDSLRVRGEGSLLATGTYDEATAVPPPVSGVGTRMMWYPEKAAFRVGGVSGTYLPDAWDAGNIGAYSFAAGTNTVARGLASTALGYFTIAHGESSTAIGYSAFATGPHSTALGTGTNASGESSTALGSGTTAGGDRSTALGELTTAGGNQSMAWGYQTTASGDLATASGYGSIASGTVSTALGGYTRARGDYSTAAGLMTYATGFYSTAAGGHTTAQPYGSFVIGRYNVVEGTPDTWIATEPLFVAGNGTGDATPANALTLYKNGNLIIAGMLGQNSDARLKEGIEPLEGALDRVLRLT
ncbi:MAG: hypothetical protein P8099_13340, partial [Gemmatimonadota bacterium]